HAARVGICELWHALLYFALTAGVGSLMAGAWGAAVGEAVRAAVARRHLRRLRLVAVVRALAGPLAGIILGIYRLCSSPLIFAFDPFVGYFSGTLYDTVIDAGMPLLTFRLGSLSTLVATALFASILVRDGDRRFGLVLDLRSVTTRARGVLGFAAMAASIGIL